MPAFRELNGFDTNLFKSLIMLAEPDSQKSYANQWMSNFDVCCTIVIGFERLFGSFDKNLLRGFQTDQMTNTSGNESDRDIYYHLCLKCISPCLRIDKSDTFSRLWSIVIDWHFRNMIPAANGPMHLRLFFPSMEHYDGAKNTCFVRFTFITCLTCSKIFRRKMLAGVICRHCHFQNDNFLWIW